jgi:DNA-binding response OmpR family regulator
MQTQSTHSERFYLVVEDEYLTASNLMITLEDAGAEVAGPVSSVPAALEVIAEHQSKLDGAILDINLRGEMAYPVAAQWRSCGPHATEH